MAQLYELIRLLGEGGMGVVWSALHRVTQKQVALKFLKPSASPELTLRFLREARAVGAVRHPNVIEIHDIFTLDDGVPAMVMDLLEGESLADRLERGGALGWEELLRIMIPVLLRSALRMLGASFIAISNRTTSFCRGSATAASSLSSSTSAFAS